MYEFKIPLQPTATAKNPTESTTIKSAKPKGKSKSLSEHVKTVAWSVIKVAMVTAIAGARPVPGAVLEYLTNIIYTYVIASIQKKR